MPAGSRGVEPVRRFEEGMSPPVEEEYASHMQLNSESAVNESITMNQRLTIDLNGLSVKFSVNFHELDAEAAAVTSERPWGRLACVFHDLESVGVAQPLERFATGVAAKISNRADTEFVRISHSAMDRIAVHCTPKLSFFHQCFSPGGSQPKQGNRKNNP